MRGSWKNAPADEFQDWKNLRNEHWKPRYANLRGNIKDELRYALFKEQQGLCVYCGRSLSPLIPGETSHVEHFRPKSKYAEKELDHENLYLSCGPRNDTREVKNTCGNAKGDWFFERSIVEPIYPHCISEFNVKLDGSIVGKTEEAETMVSVLNLNHRELMKMRQDVLDYLDSEKLDPEDFWLEDGGAMDLAHIAYYHFGRMMPNPHRT